MKHSHYFKDVSNLTHIDVYRVLQLFGVTDPCLQHAAKKLLVAGARGAKDIEQDVQEAIDTLTRWKDMRIEEKTQQQAHPQAAEGKPKWDYAPEWALWLVQSPNGNWFWTNSEPYMDNGKRWVTQEPGIDFYAGCSDPANWELSLEARP